MDGAGSRSGRATAVFAAAVAAVALHVVDDAFVSTEPGARAADHVVSALVPLAVLALAALLWRRARPGARAAAALALGPLALAGFGPALAHASRAGAAGDDWTGFLLLPAGIALCALGATTLWRSRKGGRGRWARRALLAVMGVLGAYWVVVPIAVAIVATHRPREPVTALELGRPSQTATIRTSDGLRLHGRYARSRNGAAVIVFPGSASRAPQARMLVRHGYGVLMLAMRGYGRSDGDPNAFGWGATKDVAAGIAFLRRRPDVRNGRIGGLGFSVGGEQLLESAAENPGLRAVVSDGAGQRSVREAALRGPRAWFTLPLDAIATAAITVLSGNAPPPGLDDVVARIAPRPVFFIYAGRGAGGEDLQPHFYKAAREPKQIWRIPGATHTGGFAAEPRAYGQRVTRFFDSALSTRKE